MNNVNADVIEKFLEGRDRQKYIVGIEAPYHENKVFLVINNPNKKAKNIEVHRYKPFLWMKHEVSQMIYNGDRYTIRKKMREYGIKIKKLKIQDPTGHTPKRLEEGYKYLVTTDNSYNKLLAFFKDGGIDVFDEDYRRLFLRFSPSEQFMIQTGKRLFKGMEDYDDLDRLQYDLETTGLNPKIDSIFQIGVRNNRGFEEVLEVRGDTPKERRDQERAVIIKFFMIIDKLKPDLITGYNSENFDWDFLFQRCERLSIDIGAIAKTLSNSKIRRKDSTIKLGQETEYYKQTYMWGYSVIDISHAVRRAQAINSDIKGWGLKYITQYADAAKPNRVYVQGDRIHSTWADTENDYAFNDTDGDWYRITEERPLKDGYELTTGAKIVYRYLQDDLWETDKVDSIFNQAAFLLAKLLPTSYMRSSTMGTAGTWKLIMAAWSYENGLGIPDTEAKRDFTGGLSRLLEVGFARRVIKLDYAALYPNTQLTWDIIPDLDISGVMKGLLLYIAETRDTYKDLKNEFAAKGDQKMADLYDKKQLPLKILANSFFGSFGAPYIFNWGDSDSAEETTCRGRQYLRLMVKHFHEKYNFRPLVGDTDGFNFAIPDEVDDIKFTPKGTHRFTEKYAGVELTGTEAVVAEFNELYMIGRMGLDIDDVCKSTINFARKNYANEIIKGQKNVTVKDAMGLIPMEEVLMRVHEQIDPKLTINQLSEVYERELEIDKTKIKLVGNTIKSNKMPKYIEEFLAKGIRMLLDGNGYDFVQYYYDYVETIYNFQIPLAKIASKSKVKKSVAEYQKDRTKKNKAGNPMPRQAHMELIIKEGMKVNLGDVIYYVNTGTMKSHGDLKTKKDKETDKVEIQLNCKLVDKDILENNPDYIEDTYNVPKYLDAFNKRIRPLLVCFEPEIREVEKVVRSKVKRVDNILISMVKDKETKKMVLEPRKEFTFNECKLTAGKPFEESDQDTYENLMTMEDKEIRFWVSVGKTPNDIEPEAWQKLQDDYFVRLDEERKNGIQSEKEALEEIFRKIELKELTKIEDTGKLPIEILMISEMVEEEGQLYFKSRKWGENLHVYEILFKYQDEAEARQHWYNTSEGTTYDDWLDHKAEYEIMSGGTMEFIEVEPKAKVIVGNTEKEPTKISGETITMQEEVVVEAEATIEEVAEEPPEEEDDEWSNF